MRRPASGDDRDGDGAVLNIGNVRNLAGPGEQREPETEKFQSMLLAAVQNVSTVCSSQPNAAIHA